MNVHVLLFCLHHQRSVLSQHQNGAEHIQLSVTLLELLRQNVENDEGARPTDSRTEDSQFTTTLFARISIY